MMMFVCLVFITTPYLLLLSFGVLGVLFGCAIVTDKGHIKEKARAEMIRATRELMKV